MSRITDSFHNISAAYMVKNRPDEFTTMHEYVTTFNDKLGVLDRISQRVLREQQGIFYCCASN
jgi:sorting nexin-7/30